LAIGVLCRAPGGCFAKREKTGTKAPKETQKEERERRPEQKREGKPPNEGSEMADPGKPQWRPMREVEIVAGTPPGGGLDRTARALAKAIVSERLLDVPVKVVNIPGDGARKAWSYLERHAGDPHVVSISSPNLTTDHLVGMTTFDHAAFTPLAILYNEYIAFITRADSAIVHSGDLLQRLGTNAASVTIALSTALGNPNHIALAKVIRHAGGDVKAPKICVFDSALDALADVTENHSDIAAITAASAVKALSEGAVRALAVSAPTRLAAIYANCPTWVEQSVDCVIGAWRGVTGARGLTPAHIAFWERVLVGAVASAEWQADLARHYWTSMHLDGARLQWHLQREQAEMASALAELGLLGS
jgi:putative tricarboxylic transport membrane protein